MTLATYGAQASVILLGALAVCRIARRRSAAWRSAILSASLAAAAALPLFAAVTPRFGPTFLAPATTSLPDLPNRPDLPDNAIPSVPTKPASVVRAPDELPETSATPPSVHFRSIPSPWPYLRWAWLAGITFGVSRILQGIVRLRRFERTSDPVPEGRIADMVTELRKRYGVRRPITILGRRGAAPMTWGFARPKLLLPAEALEWTEQRLRIVVAHELAHVRRADWMFQIFAEIQRAIFWFNPLWWIAVHRLVEEGERAADDLALTAGIDGMDNAAYAEELLSLARAFAGPRSLPAAIAMARASVIERRFEALVNLNMRRDAVTPRIAVAMIGAFAAAATILAACRPAQVVAAPFASPAAVTIATATESGEPAASAPVVPSTAQASASAVQAVQTSAPGATRAIQPPSKTMETVTLRGQVRTVEDVPAFPGLWVRASPEDRTSNVKSYAGQTGPIITYGRGSLRGNAQAVRVPGGGNGRYEMELPPGRYILSLEDPSGVYPTKIQSTPKAVTVLAGTAGVNPDVDFAFTIPPGTATRMLSGRVGFEDGTPLPVGSLPQFRVILWPEGSSSSSIVDRRITQPFTNTQGMFMFSGTQPGAYAVTLAPLRLGFFLKSMTYGGVDLTRDPLVLGLDASDTSIQVVLTRTRPIGTPPGVKVSGKLREPLLGSTALTLRTPLAEWPNEFYEIADIDPKADGSFEVNGVPPGLYALGRRAAESTVFFNVGTNDVRDVELSLTNPGVPLASIGARGVPLSGGGRGGGQRNPLTPNAPHSINGIVELGDSAIPTFEVELSTPGVGTSQTVKVSERQFSVTILDGVYRIRILSLPQGYAVRSVGGGPLDLTEQFFIIGGRIADRFTGIPVRSASGITIRLERSPSGQ